MRRALFALVMLAGRRLTTRPARPRRHGAEDRGKKSERPPEPPGLQHNQRMHRSARVALASLVLFTACRNGSCRPPPDPEPADSVPVGADNPNKPIEQPTPPEPRPPPK